MANTPVLVIDVRPALFATLVLLTAAFVVWAIVTEIQYLRRTQRDGFYWGRWWHRNHYYSPEHKAVAHIHTQFSLRELWTADVYGSAERDSPLFGRYGERRDIKQAVEAYFRPHT